MDSFSFNYSIWIIQTVALMVTCLIIPGLKVSGPIPALLTVVVLGFINAHLWSAALFFNLPDSLTTHALLVIFANAALFWLVVKLLPGISISGIIPAIVAPLLFSISSLMIGRYSENIDWGRVWREGSLAVQSVKERLEQTPRPGQIEED